MTDTAPSTNTVDATSTPCHATRWRLATLFCVILLALAGATGMSMMEQFKAQLTHLQKKLKTVPQVKYVAVLLDEKHLPAQLISFDAQDGYVQIQRLNDVKEGREQSLQLWALDDNERALPLGVITPGLLTGQIRVPEAVLTQTQSLAVSVENKGGAESGQLPRLPYLFLGKLIRKAL